MKRGNHGFTLIELMISIALMVIISSAIYFSLNGALASWFYSRDEMCLQKTLSDTMDRLISGTFEHYGLKDSLEILSAGTEQMEYVAPWIDDSHTVATPAFVYDLNRPIKPGTGVPIAQVKLPESDSWRIYPVNVVESENRRASKVTLGAVAPEGSGLRFVYHPDSEMDPEVVSKLHWDSDKKEIFLDGANGEESLSKNLFGVEISSMKLHFYTNTNQLVTDRTFVDLVDLTSITAVEVSLEAELDGKTRTLTRFISLRNAPMRTGYISLKKGMRIRIPDSRHIQTLLVTNLTGISDKDRLQLEATPRSGKSWRLTLVFERIGSARPVVKTVTVEYPPQKIVYTDTPMSDAILGLNLKIIDPQGLYDYDDDEDVDDVVLLEGEVELKVTEMDMQGGGLFVRP